MFSSEEGSSSSSTIMAKNSSPTCDWSFGEERRSLRLKARLTEAKGRAGWFSGAARRELWFERTSKTNVERRGSVIRTSQCPPKPSRNGWTEADLPDQAGLGQDTSNPRAWRKRRIELNLRRRAAGSWSLFDAKALASWSDDGGRTSSPRSRLAEAWDRLRPGTRVLYELAWTAGKMALDVRIAPRSAIL